MSFSFNFAKVSKGRHFNVCRSKNLKLSQDTAIDSTFQKMYWQVYFYFPLSVIKFLSAVSSESKQQVRGPVISTIVDGDMSNIKKRLAEIFEWCKIKDVNYFCFGNKRRQKRQEVSNCLPLLIMQCFRQIEKGQLICSAN